MTSQEHSALGMRALHQALTLEQEGADASAIDAANQALEHFGQGGDRTGAAAAHQLLALLLGRSGRLHDALAQLEAALPLRQATNDREGLAALHQGRVELLAAMQRHEAALEASKDLFEVAEALSDRDSQAMALHQQVQLLMALGRSEDAARAVERGLWVSDRAGEERARSAFQQLQARLDLAEGGGERALRRAHDALELARRARSRATVVDALQELATVHRRQGDPGAALPLLEEALDGAELLRDLMLRAGLLADLADAEHALGRNREAVARLMYQARTWEELDRVEDQLEALHAAGELAASSGQAERALDIAGEQVAAAERSGRPELLAAAWQTCATRAFACRDLRQSERAFAEAARARGEAGQREAQAVTLSMLGQVQLAQGRRDDGLRTLQDALTRLRSLGSTQSEALAELIREVST